MSMSRRAFLGTTSTLVLGATVAACTSAQIQGVATAVVSDADLIDTGLQGAFKTIASVSKIAPATVTAVNTALGDIDIAVKAVAGSLTNAAAQTPVQNLVAAVTALGAALTGVTVPVSMQSALTAAETLLPIIAQAVGLAMTFAAPHNGMTPDAARKVLITASLAGAH
jgi:hypothetical protein